MGKGADDDGDNNDGGNEDDMKDDNAFFRNFFFAAILDLPFLTFFVGVTIEVDIFHPLEVLASGGVPFLIVFATDGV
jgi:hypothetical protein